MSNLVLEVNDNLFQAEVIESELPVLVDFWAPWCVPCRMVAPFIDQVAKEYEGKLKVVKCNIDENPKTPSQYSVTSIPTLCLFKQGQNVQTNVGALPLAQIKAFIDKNL